MHFFGLSKSWSSYGNQEISTTSKQRLEIRTRTTKILGILPASVFTLLLLLLLLRSSSRSIVVVIAWNSTLPIFMSLSNSVWPDWAIFWTLGNFLKPLATVNLPKSSTFLGNFCEVVKINHFSSEIIFGQLLLTFGDFFWSHCWWY